MRTPLANDQKGMSPGQRLYEYVGALGVHGPKPKAWADQSPEHQAKWHAAYLAASTPAKIELVERLRAEISPERHEEIMSKGWDYAIRHIKEKILAGEGLSDHARSVAESWMIDGKDELIEEAANALTILTAERDALAKDRDAYKGMVISKEALAAARLGVDFDDAAVRTAIKFIKENKALTTQLTASQAEVASLREALLNIRELNMAGADENGHRWANSDLIDQEIRAAIEAGRVK